MSYTWRADAVQGGGGANGGGGMTYPPAGIAVSTGTAWGTSIDPSSIPQIIQVADEATALSSSAANPNNFYFWV